jgi:hypothetical protein
MHFAGIGVLYRHADPPVSRYAALVDEPQPNCISDTDSSSIFPIRAERLLVVEASAPAPAAQPAYKVVKREKDRWWEVRDPRGGLACVTVYKRGAVEVVRPLAAYWRTSIAAAGA